jgi:hypothetical protein
MQLIAGIAVTFLQLPPPRIAQNLPDTARERDQDRATRQGHWAIPLRIAPIAGVLFLSSAGAMAQGLSLEAVARLNELFLTGAEWANHTRQIVGAATRFEEALRYAREAEAGQRPHDPTGRYGSLVGDYLSVAKAIQSETVATDFDEAPFTVSWKDYYGCHTRDGAVTTLRDYSEALGNAISRGEYDQKRYGDLMGETNRVRSAADQLQRILEKSAFLNLFAMDWLAIENQVKPSLAVLFDAIDKKQKALAASVPRVRARKSNLDGNLHQLIGVECNLAGAWAGTITVEDQVIPMAMEIRGEPGSYKITYSLKGKWNNNPCVIVLNAGERRLDLRPSCNPPSNSLRISLSFAASYTSLTGIETDDEDSLVRFPIVMQRR